MAAGRITRSLTAHGGDVDLDRDRALVQRCQGGDGAAFAELYTQYHDRLHRFCVRRLLNKDEADEVTQEAFLRAWRALPTFAGDLRFYPWLTVIAKNLCTDALRRQARYGTVANFDRVGPDATRPDAFSTAISSEETVMASYDGELAAQALTRLSERHRKVLALREEAGLSYQEIARAEGVEISTVETLLWRARQALKREYTALSGVRVLGGIFVAGGAVGRLLERAARRSMRVALAVSRLNPRGLATAGAVTVALASVAAIQMAPPANTSPVALAATAVTPLTSPAATPVTSPTPLTTVGSTAPSAPVTAPAAGGSLATSPSSPGTAGLGAPALPSVPDTQPAQGGAQLPSSVTAAVPALLGQVTSTLNSLAAGSVPTLPLPIPSLPAVPPIVSKTTNGLGGALGGN